MQERVTSSYEHALQAAYYHIANRGICVNISRVEEAKAIVAAEISRQLSIASKQWGCTVFVGAANAPVLESERAAAVNLNATQGEFQLLKKLKDFGYEVIKIAKKNEDGEYESNYSTGELALQKMLSRNQFNYPAGDPAIKAILKVRELGKLNSAYLNARLYKRGQDYFFLTNYNVAGTLSGRRSSRRHTFRFGNNAQNFPKHSDVASMYRKCLVARPGNIFLMVDQISAEDWPVSALAGNISALTELRSGVDRHTKLASTIFNIPLTSRTPVQWKESMERYLGKKTRHASNYDMGPGRMSDALAQEGFAFSIDQCKLLLERVAQHDPSIKGVFHKYVQENLNKTRILTTPFGRERQFLGLRPNDSNHTIFKEAYSFIPQSTVGDNTGFTVLKLESEYPTEERAIVQEGHDSIVQDVRADAEVVYKYLLRVQTAFSRTIKFYNGIELEIPIEAEVGFDFNTTVKIKEFSRKGVAEAIEKLRDELAAKEKNCEIKIA
jgi:DNA polymerase I-like protein with 3'-5' exonuclease and polymerase domains